jgi:hypothetical protein
VHRIIWKSTTSSDSASGAQVSDGGSHGSRFEQDIHAAPDEGCRIPTKFFWAEILRAFQCSGIVVASQYA